MSEQVTRTVRCPHCASPDAAPSRPRVSIADAACRLAGYTPFRCGQCCERFFARSVSALSTDVERATAAAEPSAGAGVGEKKRNALRKELAKAKTALAKQQERTARAEKAAVALRTAPQRIAELQNDLASATAALAEEQSAGAALREELAAETERVNRLEREAAQRAAAALLDRGQAAAERPEELAAAREELATVKAAASAELADAQSALLAATERAEAFEKEVAAMRDVQANRPAPVDAEALLGDNRSLRESLARESERRAKLERDVRDLREGWAYDMARWRTESAGTR